MKTCPLCHSEPIKILYYGLPVLLCENENCNCLYGFWSFFTDHLPYNGVMFAYNGRYLPALFDWIFIKQ